jgi:hypothetical protein
MNEFENISIETPIMCVDISTHVCHAFVQSEDNDRNRRVELALKQIWGINTKRSFINHYRCNTTDIVMKRIMIGRGKTIAVIRKTTRHISRRSAMSESKLLHIVP